MNVNPIQRLAILDFETTHLNSEQGRIIEGAVILTEVTEDLRIGETLDSYWSFNDPGFAIPLEIVKLTGISDEQVRGQQLDWNRFHSILDRADFLISHNAVFDRAWLERWGEYKKPHWACSLQMIEWNRHGMPCRTLKHLAWEHNYFPNAHRAIDDVNTLIYLLRSPTVSQPETTYGQELLNAARQKKYLVFAYQAPFESKDLLKEEKFRWSPDKKVWWKLVPESELNSLARYMEERIYLGPPKHKVSEPIDALDPSFRSRYGLV